MFRISSLILSVATTICSATLTLAGEFSYCWQDENKFTACRVSIPVDLPKIANVCPEIVVYDEELLVDYLRCSGVMMCWIMNDNEGVPSLGPWNLIKSAANVQLPESLIQEERALPKEQQEPVGEEACAWLQDALDSMMPVAIEALR